jgi:hypothetical protein
MVSRDFRRRLCGSHPASTGEVIRETLNTYTLDLQRIHLLYQLLGRQRLAICWISILREGVLHTFRGRLVWRHHSKVLRARRLFGGLHLLWGAAYLGSRLLRGCSPGWWRHHGWVVMFFQHWLFPPATRVSLLVLSFRHYYNYSH